MSFSNPAVAELMNRWFVSIKVDREERPDIDKVYMAFVEATTGSGGWPMTVFLTPDRKPFFGGTYFPLKASTDGSDCRPCCRVWRKCGASTTMRSCALQTRSLSSSQSLPAPRVVAASSSQRCSTPPTST